MSRYTIELGPKKTFNYGFDDALGYWCDILDESGEEDNLELDLSTTFGSSRSDILEAMESHGAKEEHCMAIASDLPF